MQSAALGILLLIVHAARQESGYLPDENDEPGGEIKADFDCFINMTVKMFLCYLTNTNAWSPGSISLTACSKISCDIMERNQDIYILEEISMLVTFNVCLTVQEKQMCKQFEGKKIVKPDPPFGVAITHNKIEKEYSISINASYKGQHLHDQLVCQIALRKQDEEWPDCNSFTDTKQCKNISYTETQISETELEPATKYELKVRSKPNGHYYSGHWSDWSLPQTFESQDMPQETGGNVILLWILITVGFIVALVAIILISVFWKSRIKPCVWPEIPDHKSTLEQLCKKPIRDQHMSFNPDIFEDIHINKVDYIKAKPPSEDYFHQAQDDVVRQTDPRDITTCILNAIPERNNEDLSFSENQDAQDGKAAEHDGTDDATNSLLTNPVIHINVTKQPCGSYFNPANGFTALFSYPTVENSPICSNTAKQATNGCREKAYITMSAFKMPTNGVK